ncbi:hypothetical protein ACWKW4_17555 [Hydrogenophaga borbori]
MFEHLRNWPRAFAKVARWLNPSGRFSLLRTLASRSDC